MKSNCITSLTAAHSNVKATVRELQEKAIEAQELAALDERALEDKERHVTGTIKAAEAVVAEEEAAAAREEAARRQS